MKDFDSVQQYRERFIEVVCFGLIVLIIVVLAHITSSYSSLFNRQLAFICHPESDSFLIVELKKEMQPTLHWKYFNPFFPASLKPCFSEIDSVKEFSNWSEIKDQFELLDKNPQLWLKKRESWQDQQIKSVYSKIKQARQEPEDYFRDLRNLHAEFRLRADLSIAPLIPSEWETILASVKQDKKDEECGNDIIAVDVIIMDGTLVQPVKVKILHSALLVRGASAYKLSQYSYYSY
ncbi:MAG TPA: hypothetical protein PLV78_11485 [Deltaproteobacteria bacterium]|nr:hypothetical protein [Deltaproteobacteria bacterium]